MLKVSQKLNKINYCTILKIATFIRVSKSGQIQIKISKSLPKIKEMLLLHRNRNHFKLLRVKISKSTVKFVVKS